MSELNNSQNISKITLRALLLFLLFNTTSVFSQENVEDIEIERPESPTEFIFKPRISLGVGMFTFKGDISKGQKTNTPVTSRLGYDLRISQRINPYLDFSFYVLFGSVGANQRSATSNLNFNSQVRVGGVNLTYNFNQLFSADRSVEPFFTVGFESFEFFSKTDLYDANGNAYNYWSDGSIRNLPENASNKKEAVIINRDFKYETDIRKLNVDSFGAYSQRSYAIPIGLGANFNISDKVKFRIGTSLHFTFTDMIDGISNKSIGTRAGDASNDKFIFSSFSLSYNLVKGGQDKSSLLDDYNGDEVDILAIGNADTDGDGIIDFLDDCPDTPSESEIDKKGCPLDGDNDGVANYLDDELDTPDSLIVAVNQAGVGMSNDDLELLYRQFMDSTGAYTSRKVSTVTNAEPIKKPKKYMVQLGEFSEGVPSDLVDLFMSVKDVKTIERGDTTIFTVGNYDNLPEAIRRQYKLKKGGVDGQVVYTAGNGVTKTVSNKEIADAVNNMDKNVLNPSSTNNTTDETSENISDVTQNSQTNNNTNKNNDNEIPLEINSPNGTIFRVQIGAFSNKISANVFDGVADVIGIPGEDGLTRYMSGTYENFDDAVNSRLNIITKGFDGAFVVALKDGKRISLYEAGATKAKRSKLRSKAKDKKFSMNKGKIKYKVQIGAFQQRVPTKTLEQFMSLGNVESKNTGGVTKYVIGTFNTLEEAKKYKNEIVNQGVNGAFVVGDFDGKIITTEEAVQLDNQ